MAKKWQKKEIYLGIAGADAIREFELEDVIIHLMKSIPYMEKYSILWDMESKGMADGTKIIGLGFNEDESKMIRIDAITDFIHGFENVVKGEDGYTRVISNNKLFLEIRYKHKIIVMETHDIKLPNPIN